MKLRFNEKLMHVLLQPYPLGGYGKWPSDGRAQGYEAASQVSLEQL